MRAEALVARNIRRLRVGRGLSQGIACEAVELRRRYKILPLHHWLQILNSETESANVRMRRH